jgi:phosphoglycolate phosphatase
MRLAIFDFDGTLCATRDAIVYCMQRTFAAFGEAIPDTGILAGIISTGIGLPESIQRLRGAQRRAGLDETEKWVECYRSIYDGGEGAARTYLFDGIADLFRRLSENGVATVVVSNKGLRAVRAALDRFGLSCHVSQLVCDAPGNRRKPDAKLFHTYVVPRFPLIPIDDTWVIGDTGVDLLFGRNIGAHCCWCTWGYGNPEECLSLNPDMVAAEPGEIAKLL